MNKKWLFIASFVALVLLALWSPWLYAKINFSQILGFNQSEGIAGLQVNSLAGEIEVFLNGEIIGTSSADKSPLSIDTIKPGDYLVTLKRKSDIRGAYWDFNKLITFTEGTTVIISFNLGPEESFSEGQVIYAIKKNNQSSNVKLNMEFNLEDPSIEIEETTVQKVNSKQYTAELPLDKPRKISISKDGYEDLSFTILPDSEEERRSLSQFDLDLSIYLMLRPVIVE